MRAKYVEAAATIYDLARSVNAGQHVGIADRLGLGQVHRAFEEPGEIGLKSEELLKGRQIAPRFEFNEKVGIACSRVEILSVRNRAEDLQMPDAITAAEGRDIGAPFVNQAMHI